MPQSRQPAAIMYTVTMRCAIMLQDDEILVMRLRDPFRTKLENVMGARWPG